MSIMKKAICVFLVLLVLLISLSACTPLRYTGNDQPFHVVVVVNAPLCTGINAKSSLLETDNYGRQLFSYNSGSKILIGVTQFRSDEIVGYYEDYCCYYKELPVSLRGEKIEEIDNEKILECFTQEEINAVKDINDWNVPVVESKITKRQFPMDNDVAEYLQTNLKIAEDYFTKAIGSETDACYEIKQLDMDQNGNALYYVYVYKKNDSSYKRIIYLILKKSDNSDFDIAAEEMRDIFGYQDQLHKFKEENGWVFK